MMAASSGSAAGSRGVLRRRAREFSRRAARAVPASADLVLGPSTAAAELAAAAAGTDRSATLLAVDGEASWQQRVPLLDPDTDRRFTRSRTVVVTAESRPALARMLAPSTLVGDAARVVVAIPETDVVVDGEPLAPDLLPLRFLPPRVAAVRHGRRRGHVLVDVRYVNAGPVAAVVRGVSVTADALARGRGAGGLQVAVGGAAGLEWVSGDPRARLATAAWAGDVYRAAGRSLDVLLVDDDWLADDPAVRARIIAEARNLGAGVVRLPAPPRASAPGVGSGDASTQGAAGVVRLPAPPRASAPGVGSGDASTQGPARPRVPLAEGGEEPVGVPSAWGLVRLPADARVDAPRRAGEAGAGADEVDGDGEPGADEVDGDGDPGAGADEVERDAGTGADEVERDAGTDEPPTAAFADDPVEVTALPPVDLAVCRPTGFRAEDTGECVAVATAPSATGEVLAAAAAGEAVDVHRLAPHAPLPAHLVDRAHGARAVVDHPALHDDVLARARVVAGLAAAGAPLVLLDPGDPLAGPLAGLLGEAVLAQATEPSLADLADPLARERHSVALRRAALTRHGPEPRWRELRRLLGLPSPPPRTVSVVTSTNRPEMLDHLAAQLAAQRHPHVEAVVALHGSGFDDTVEPRLREAAGIPLTVLRPPGEATLGAVLDRLSATASGELVTKMDDDDWYGPDHLTDLELAWQYSNAEVIGKAAEFVHLGDLDVTIRRFTGGAEAYNDRVAGGTLLIARGDLAAAGGWRDAPRAVDRLLLDDVRAVGGSVYRAHGFGFVLTRRPSGHTWDVETGYFLRQSAWQRRGLALDAAGVAGDA